MKTLSCLFLMIDHVAEVDNFASSGCKWFCHAGTGKFIPSIV